MGESPLAFTQVWFPSTHRLGRVPVQPRIWGCTCCLGSLSGYQFGVLCPTLLVLPLPGPSSPRSSGFSHCSPLCVPHMVPCATDVLSPGFLPHSVGWGLLDHCNTRDDSEHEEFFNTPANLWSMSKSLLLSLQTSSQKSQFQMVKVVNLKKNPKPQTPGFPHEVIPEMLLAIRAVDGDLPSLTKVSLERWVLSLSSKPTPRHSGVTPSDSPDCDCPHRSYLVTSSPTYECHSKNTKNDFF